MIMGPARTGHLGNGPRRRRAYASGIAFWFNVGLTLRHHRRAGGPLRFGVVTRAGTLAMIVALSLVIVVPSATAQPREIIQASAGLTGFYTQGRPAPIDIVINADRLISGELRVRTDLSSGSPVISIPVEVAGGSVKRYSTVLPTSPWNEIAVVRVELRSDGEIIDSTQVQLRAATDQVLVAVLPGVASARDLPGTASLVGRSGTARLASLGLDVLGAESAPAPGIVVLEAFDVLVARTGDLQAMAPGTLFGVLAWVAGGGELLIDDPPQAELPAALATDRPDGAEHWPIGNGLVRLTSGRAQAGDWSSILLPTPIRRWAPPSPGLSWLGPDSGASVSSAIATDAGFRLPSGMAFAAIIGAYVVLVGPLFYLGFTRADRSNALWLAIPAAAAVFAGSVWVIGTSLRSNAQDAHGTVVEAVADGAVSVTYALVGSTTGTTRGLDLPPRWTTAFSADRFTGSGGVTFVDQSAQPSIKAELGPGEYSLLAASGPDPRDGWLALSAHSDRDGNITGEVRNTGPVALEQVAVFHQFSSTLVGSLPAGASRDPQREHLPTVLRPDRDLA